MRVLRYAGFAPETGDPLNSPAPAAVFDVDIASASLDVPSDSTLIHTGGIGRGARLWRPGYYAPAGNIVYSADIRTIGWMFKWALGGYAFTPGSPLNLHEIWTSEDSDLDPFCVREGKDLLEHVFRGCIIAGLTMQVSDGFVTVTADIISRKDEEAELRETVDLILPDEFPLAFHEVTGSLNGNAYSTKIKEFTLNITNGADAPSGRRIGNRFPHRLRAFERTVTIDLGLAFDDTDDLHRFWGNSSGADAFGQDEFSLEFTLNSGVYGSADIAFPRCVYTSTQQQPSGRTEMPHTGSVQAFMGDAVLADSTDIRTEMLVTLQNEVDSMEVIS